MAELVRDNVRLEHPHVAEDGDVTRQEVARPQREWEDEPCEGEVADLGARLDPLPRDARDVAREVPVDLDRQLTPRDASRRELVIHPLDEKLDLCLAHVAWHRLHVMHVSAELAAKVDLPHTEPRVPILGRAP